MPVSDDNLLSPQARQIVDASRRQLFGALDGLEGEKTVIFDRSLMRRVNLFAGPSVLKTHGVVANRALDNPTPISTPHAVFLLSPTLKALDGLCAYIDHLKNDSRTLLQVFFVPEAWYVVREKLKERNDGKYWERLESVKELPLWWLPQDGDCLSLAEPHLVSRLLLNGDWTHLHRCAVAVNQILEMCNGKVPIYHRGNWAKEVASMVQKMRTTGEPGHHGHLNLNRMVIIDRWLDPLTPMMTQLTYAGLLDEIYGIDIMNTIKVPEDEFMEVQEITDATNPFERSMKEIYLNDELYNVFRHVHYESCGREISTIVKEIKKDKEIDREKMSIAEYQILVKKLPYIKKREELLTVHTRLVEMVREQLFDRAQIYRAERVNEFIPELLETVEGDRIVPFIEEMIMEAADLYIVLRLISIQSLTSGGLKPTILAQYRRLVMQSYGSEAVNIMLKMQKISLIKEKGGSGKFTNDYPLFLYAQMKAQYKLYQEGVDGSNTSNPGYAYSGYCSLLTRILAEGDSINWDGWLKIGEHGGGDNDRTAVFIVGGVTRAELAILKQLPNICLVTSSSLLTAGRLLDNITKI